MVRDDMDPATGRGPRYGIAAVYSPALGDLVVFGPITKTGAPTRQTWLWNGTRWIIAAEQHDLALGPVPGDQPADPGLRESVLAGY
jgi:hypothetical protein